MARGEGVATLRDVAEHAGVHVATASRALNSAQSHLVTASTRQRVLDAAASLDYRANAVARSLRRGKTGTLGLVVADLANPFIVTLLRGVEEETRAHDLLPLVVETRDDPAALRSAVQRLLDNRVDAIILTAAHLADEIYIAEVSKQIPLVLAVRGFGEDDQVTTTGPKYQVMQDDQWGAYTAVIELIRLGHRRIAQLAGTEQISSFVNRGRGFASAMSTETDTADVSMREHARESTVAEGRRLTSELLTRPLNERPTAIFAHNDLMAVGALAAAREAGLECPADISIVGYNDAPLVDHLVPALTTVKLPAFEIGRHSARVAIAAISGTAASSVHELLFPEYIERNSTGPAPRQ